MLSSAYTGLMRDRASCERRVYRLATLLTGNPNAATAVIRSVLRAQPDLREIDSAHMDRLTVLRSREIRAATLVSKHVPHAIAEALASLTAQQREAWVLVRVYRQTVREASRSMDCSMRAATRHLEIADQQMRRTIRDSADDAGDLLLRYSMSLDVPQFYRVAQKRQRTRKLIVAIALLIGGLAILLLIAAVIGAFLMDEPIL